jgi:1-acyl-sn-glycerol-3-phosphate acyltransferase
VRRTPIVRDGVYRVALLVGRALFRLVRLRRRVMGAEHLPTGPAVLAISHFGYLDFALAEQVVWEHRRRLVRFLVTGAAFAHPVAGPLLRAMRHIAVHRCAGAAAYRRALRALRDGEVVGVFPESRVTSTFQLLPFKPGAAALAIEAQVPLVPVVVWGGHRLLTRTHRPGLRNAWRVPVTVSVGPPLAPIGDVESLTRRLRAAMADLLAEAQLSYPDDGAGAWWQPANLGGAAPRHEDLT